MRAAQELDAVVAFELARRNAAWKEATPVLLPQLYADTVIGYAQETKFTKPFFIHADHITVKSAAPEAIASARDLIEAQLAAGYTSFAIDASFNELPDNINHYHRTGPAHREGEPGAGGRGGGNQIHRAGSRNYPPQWLKP